MKTKTVRVDELEGRALDWAMENLTPFRSKIAKNAKRWLIAKACGPVVEVPAELVEVSDE